MEIFGWTPKKIAIMITIGLCVIALQKIRSHYFYKNYNIEEYFKNSTNEKKDCMTCGKST
jgi:hypothetical protein